MPEQEFHTQRSQQSKASANSEFYEESEGFALQPPQLQFDVPPLQMKGEDMVFTEREVYGNSSDPDAPDMVFTENEVYGQNSEDDQVDMEISEQEADENTANHFYQQGRRYFDVGNYERALVFFQRAQHAANLDPNTASQLLYNMGVCNYRLNRFAAAINFFELYLTQHPDNAEAQGMLEQSRQRSNAPNFEGETNGENVYANPSGDLANENRPENSLVTDESQQTYQRAMRQFRHGDYRSAIYLFEQARQAGNLSASDNADLLYNLGICHLRMRRFATAVTYIEQYLRQNPGNSEAQDHLREAQRGAGIV